MEALMHDPRWTFPLSYWKKSSPSRVEGMSFTDELIGQAKGVQYVTRMATQLRLPAQAIFAATLYLHRFYTRNSLKRIHPYQIAAACVFLACKTEETPRKLKDVAAITTKVALKLDKDMREIESQHSKEVEQWIRVIPMREDDLLQTLKFDFKDTAPYDTLNALVNKFLPPDVQPVVGSKAMMFINDSCRTLLCMEVSMTELAVVALYWASKNTRTPIPDFEGAKWYSKYLPRQEIVQYINDMVEMIDIVRGGAAEGQQYDRMT